MNESTGAPLLMTPHLTNATFPAVSDALGMLSSLKVTNYSSQIENTSLEVELLQRGYVAKGYIVTDTVEYIKAIDINGHTVYIMLDVDDASKTITIPVNTQPMSSSYEDVSYIPQSTVLSALDCAQLDVCSVAFDCQDGVCVAGRDPRGSANPKVVTFKVRTEGNLGLGRVTSSSLSYPVIRLSDIRTAPAKTLHNSAVVLSRLRSAKYDTLLSMLSEALVTNGAVTHELNTLNHSQAALAIKMRESIATLDKYNLTFLTNPALMAARKDDFRAVQRSLVGHHEDMRKFLVLMEDIAHVTNHLAKGLADLQELNARLSQDYTMVGQSYPAEHISP